MVRLLLLVSLGSNIITAAIHTPKVLYKQTTNLQLSQPTHKRQIILCKCRLCSNVVFSAFIPNKQNPN